MPKRVQSPSSINTFKQCRRKYYYQYIEKLPTLPNIHQIRGNIAHTTLERFYDLDVSAFTEQNYRQKFKAAIQSLFMNSWNHYQNALHSLDLTGDQKRFYFEETMLMMMNWVNHFLQDFEQAREGSIVETFQKCTPIREQKYKSDNYSVQGFIDAIHHLEKEVHIIDYKTNASFEFKDEIKLQLAIYSLLYFEKHGRKPEKAGIFFLRHKQKMIKVDEELLDLARREIGFIHNHTEDKDHINHYPKTVSGLCKWSTGQCDFYEVCKPHEQEVEPQITARTGMA